MDAEEISNLCESLTLSDEDGPVLNISGKTQGNGCVPLEDLMLNSRMEVLRVESLLEGLERRFLEEIRARNKRGAQEIQAGSLLQINDAVETVTKVGPISEEYLSRGLVRRVLGDPRKGQVDTKIVSEAGKGTMMVSEAGKGTLVVGVIKGLT
ncbi:hypothetical protein ACOSQ3_021395 [Xanthoceras sorbifolium]